MSVTKIINIKVNDADVEQLNSELKSLDNNLEQVDVQSSKTSKSIDDVASNGGAIAVLDSLTGGLATKMKDTYEATKLFNFSLKGTRTALIATGIGAFVVALGVIVSYWDEIVEFITGANAELQKQIDLQNEILEDLDYELKLLDLKEKILIKEGKSTEEIKNQKLKIILLQQEENALLLDKLKSQFNIEKAQVREVTLWEKIKIAALETAGAYGEAAMARAESIVGDEEERERLKEIEDQIKEAELRSEQLKLNLLSINDSSGGAGSKKGRDRISTVGAPLTAEEQAEQLSKKQQQFEQLFDLQKMQQEQLADLGKTGLEQIANDENILEAKRTLDREAWAKRRKEIAEEEAAYQRTILNAQADVLGNFGSLLQQLGEDNKAVAIAGIIAEQIASTAKIILATTEANAKAVAASPLTAGQPWVTLNTVSAGIGIASGVAAAAKAISALGGSGGGSGAGSASSIGGGVSAPSFNVVGTSGTNQLAESLSQDSEPVQAYVVGSNVTTQQALDRNIVETATIG